MLRKPLERLPPALIMLAALVWIAPPASAGPRYKPAIITGVSYNDLFNSYVTDLNDAGQYTLRQYYPPAAPPYTWHAALIDGGGLADIHSLAGYMQSYARGLNSRGTVAGEAYVGAEYMSGPRDAYVRPYGGSMITMPQLGYGAGAFAVNDSDSVAGYAFTDAEGNIPKAVVWSNEAGWIGRWLDLPDGKTASRAFAINGPAGSPAHTLGSAWAGTDLTTSRYVVWNYDGTVNAILPADFYAVAINDSGRVLDYYGSTWSAGTVAATGLSQARSINNSGQVVGTLNGQGAIWQDGTITLLNSLLAGGSSVSIIDGYQINDRGVIIASGCEPGTTCGNEYHAYLLTPTWPIPGDANLDCTVNILDLLFIRGRLNQNVGSGDNWQADATGDGRINILDLIAVRNKLNTACP